MATNLQFVKQTSATNVSSMNITDCFSSGYDVYKVFLTKLEGYQSGNRNIHMRFIDTNSSVISGSEYSWAALNLRSYSSFSQGKSANDTEIESIELTNGEPLTLSESKSPAKKCYLNVSQRLMGKEVPIIDPKNEGKSLKDKFMRLMQTKIF